MIKSEKEPRANLPLNKLGVACLVSNAVKRIRAEEPDEGNLHTRICGVSAGQPLLLPGSGSQKAAPAEKQR